MPPTLSYAELRELADEYMADDAIDWTESEVPAWTEAEARVYFEHMLKPSDEIAKWLPDRRPRETPARLRIVCFHNAGSSASVFTSERGGNAFNQSTHLELLAVELPARNKRVHEEGYTTMSALTEDLSKVLGRWRKGPHDQAGDGRRRAH